MKKYRVIYTDRVKCSHTVIVEAKNKYSAWIGAMMENEDAFDVSYIFIVKKQLTTQREK